MKTKKMENILQFVDKNMKFKSEIRGRRPITSKRTHMSKTVKRGNKQNRSKVNINRGNINRVNINRVNINRVNRNKKIENIVPVVDE